MNETATSPILQANGTSFKYDGGKLRYDLIPPFPQEQYAAVLTFGANKYSANGWTSGMAWSRVLSALERHLYAIKRREFIDPETGLYHSAHVMCNAAFLTHYHKYYPQGDDIPTFIMPELASGTKFDNY